MLLLINCEAHTEKYLDRTFKYGPKEVRSVRKAKVRIFSRMQARRKHFGSGAAIGTKTQLGVWGAL